MRLVEGKTYTAHEFSELEIRIAELNHEKPVTALQVKPLSVSAVYTAAAENLKPSLYA